VASCERVADGAAGGAGAADACELDPCVDPLSPDCLRRPAQTLAVYHRMGASEFTSAGNPAETARLWIVRAIADDDGGQGVLALITDQLVRHSNDVRCGDGTRCDAARCVG
jgi:hypothetical protein